MCVYVYIYTHVAESKLGPRFGFFESKLGPRLRQNLVQDVLLVFPSFIVFFGVFLKSQIVCRGAKNYMWQFAGVSKIGFSKKQVAFFVSFFWMLETEKEKR